MATLSTDVLIDRHDFSKTLRVAGAVDGDTELAEGQILLGLEKFALTANNISYAASGDMLGYWNFFPAADPAWGRVPVWGFATVLRSRHLEIAEGERIFGFWPMSTHTVLSPSAVDATTFAEAGTTRSALHPWYNRYFRCAADPLYDEADDDLQPGLWALFMTGWLLADFLAANDYFGADRVVVASASSKTAYSFAFSVSQQSPSDLAVIGLTSSGNRPFVDGLGCYDQVVTYDDLASLDAPGRAVFVDMAGNASVRLAVHERYGAGLVYSCLVGGTHQGTGATDAALPGPTPQFFFVPDHSERRAAEWGRAEFTEQFAAAWRPFVRDAATHLRIEHRRGVESIERAYLDVLTGKIGPDTSVLVTL
jgi:hypothetical protein